MSYEKRVSHELGGGRVYPPPTARTEANQTRQLYPPLTRGPRRDPSPTCHPLSSLASRTRGATPLAPVPSLPAIKAPVFPTPPLRRTKSIRIHETTRTRPASPPPPPKVRVAGIFFSSSSSRGCISRRARSHGKACGDVFFFGDFFGVVGSGLWDVVLG